MLRRVDVIERLRQIARENEFPRGTLIGSGRVLVEMEIRDCDRYSAVVVELRAGARFLDVSAATSALSQGLSELNEELVLLEYDSSAGLAIMRSAKPTCEPDAVEYWEAQVRPGAVHLARYRKQHSAAERELVSVPMLHRTLASLTEQMAMTLADVE